MGDAQSAQREGEKDAAAEEEESGKVDDAQTEQNIEDEPLKKHEQISEINGEADGSIAEVNGHCEDEIAAEAILSPDQDVTEIEKPFREEETPLNVEINEKESSNEADANEDVPLEMIEIDAKQNDINESFRRFFSNIGLKLTVKRGSGDIATDVPDETNKKEPNRPEYVQNTPKETTSDDAEQNTDVNIAQETYDDSTTCPTLTDATSEDVLETVEEKPAEAKEEVESDNVDAATTSPVREHAHQDAKLEEEPHVKSPSCPEEEVVVSPIKRFFTTGIFSGLRKKKKPAEGETTEKELEDTGKNEVEEATEQTVQDQQQDNEEISLGVEAAAVEKEHKENELIVEILSAASAQTTDAATIDSSTVTVTEPEILNSQEKDKVQASPLKRLLSGSSLKKLSKRQRSRKSSDAKLSDSGDHVSDQLLSSTESADNHKEEGCAQPSAEAAGEEDGAWASFKKLLTPKKRIKRSSLSNEETQILGSEGEAKPSGGQISDHSTEEGKKRKDSSVSWESVLCGSGRRRSRKTSDSEEETPQNDNGINKQDGGSKHGAESALESSNEADEILAYSPKQAGSPSESDGGSTWKSLKRLVTPKRKAKDEDESKDNVQSDSEVTHDESSFSIKKLLPGRKKRKSAEKQDQLSSDEAEKDVASGDEDSETPAVVPLSEFDTVETEVHIETQADIESHVPKEADYELQQDLLDQIAEPVLPCDSLQTEAKKAKDNDALQDQASTTLATNEEPDDLTESISKPQLSDIPEEATPASATEEAARDDTIAEDLIEITSEAFTAPEPLDITMTDETEMISAVSQLSSESSKTSGNTTPVPAEYDFMETDMLLHQIVETISTSPKAVPLCSDELRSERKVVSVSHQILETSVKEEPTILKLHKGLDATAINTGLNVQELDAINELAATTQTEWISEVNDSVSTKTVSEVPTEEFDTAEIAVDEAHEVNVTHEEDSIKELESIDESHHLLQCLSEVNALVFTDILPEGDEIVPEDGSLLEAHQAKTEPPKMDSQEADSAAKAADETKNGAMERDVTSLTEKDAQIMRNITEQFQITDKDQQPVEVEELQELPDVQTAKLDSEESSVQAFEKEVISEDTPAAKTVTYELKEETVLLTEVSAEPEKDGELETDSAKTEHVQVPEALEVVQTSTLDSEEGSVQSEDITPAEKVTDEPKQTAEHLSEVSIEPEKKEPPVNAVKTVQEPEVLQAVQAPTDSEEDSVQSLEKSGDVPEVETVTDEPKEETVPLTEANLEPVGAAKTEHVHVPESSEAVHASSLDSEEGSVQTPKEKVKSEDITPAETVTDEPKQTAKCLNEVSVEPENKELPVNAVKTLQEPEVLEAVQAPTLDSEESSVQSLEKEVISEDVPEVETATDEPKEETVPLTETNLEPVDAAKNEHVQVQASLEAVQAPTLDSEESSIQSLEKEVISEDLPEAKTVTSDRPKEEPAEPKDETKPVTEDKLETVEAAKTEHVQVTEASEDVQASTLDLEEGSVQSLEEDVKSEDILTIDTVTHKPQKTAEYLTEVRVEAENKELPVNAVRALQESEVLEAVQAPTLDSEEGSVQSLETEVMSEDVPEAKTVIDEPKEEHAQPKEEGMPLTEVKPETVDAKTEHFQVTEASEDVQASTLDSEESIVQSSEEEVKSEDIPPTESVTGESNQTAQHLTEVSAESENKELPVNAVNTEHVQEQELLQAVEGPTDSDEGSVQSLEKEVISEAVPDVKDEPKEETVLLTEVKLEPVDASKNEHVQKPEVLEAVQAPTDSEEGSVQSLEKEFILEHVSEVETVTNEPKEETMPLTEANLEKVDAAKTEQVPEAVQASTLDSEEGSVQSPKGVKSEDIPPAETITDEPKQTAERLTEASVEPENKELPVNAVKTVQEPDILEAGQAPTDSDEGGVQSFKQQVISEDVSEAQIVTDEPKEETMPSTKVKLEPVDASKTELIQEPEVLQAVQAPTLDSEVGGLLSLGKEVISEDIPAVETVTDEPKHETKVRVEPEEKLPVEAAKTEHVQEPEALSSDVKDIATETKTEEGASMYGRVVTENVEGGIAKEPEKQTLLEDIPKPDVDNVSGSIKDKIKIEVVEQLDHSLETTEYHKTESVLQDVGLEQEDCIPEVVDKLQTLTTVCVSSVTKDASNVQVLEETVFTEETSAPSVDNTAVTNEPKDEVHLSAVQVSVEGEKESELPVTEIKTAAVEHAVVTQTVTCNLKDVSAAIPDILIEETSAITEPLTSELVFKEEVETATPFVRDDVAETAQEGSVVVMMDVPSGEFMDNQRIHVQMVDVEIKSAETIVDTVLEAVAPEAKEDVCHEMVKKVDNLSATPETEEELMNEEKEVLQHVKENLLEKVPESVVVNLEPEDAKQPDAVIEVSEVADSDSDEVEDQQAMEDSIATYRERQDDTPAVIRDATKQKEPEDLMQTPDILGRLDVSIHDQKDDLEQTKAEWEKSGAGATSEEVRSPSEELDVKKIHEEAQINQTAQSLTVTPINTGLVVPQHTGIISSRGNVESPSSLSLELKLNIQFGQAKAPVSPPPTTERNEPIKKKQMSEVRVLAVEHVKPINPTQRAENQKQTELTEVAVQETEITKPAANLDSTERDVITTQPVLLDVGIQAMETVETTEQIKSTARVTSSVQETETLQLVRHTEKRQVFLRKPILSQETNAEEPVKKNEEENDQDVWVDAEEDIYTQEKTEVSLHKVEESLEPRTEREQEDKAGLEHEFEMAPDSKTEEEQSQQEMHKTERTREIDSEGEDFAVALEHPETETVSATTMEWD